MWFRCIHMIQHRRVVLRDMLMHVLSSIIKRRHITWAIITAFLGQRSIWNERLDMLIYLFILVPTHLQLITFLNNATETLGQLLRTSTFGKFIYPSRCPRVRSLNFHDLYIVKPVIPMIAVFLTISHHEQSFPTHKETFDVDASASAGAVTCLSSFGSFIVVPTKCYKIYAIWYAFMYYSISYFVMIWRFIWLSLVLTKFHYSARTQFSISKFNGCISTWIANWIPGYVFACFFKKMFVFVDLLLDKTDQSFYFLV